MPSEAQPSVRRGTALSPVRGSGLWSTEVRKMRSPVHHTSTELPSGHSPSRLTQYAAHARVARSKPLA